MLNVKNLITAVIAGGCLVTTAADACTGMRMTAKDNSIVYGRTLEFGLPLPTDLIAIPKGTQYTGSTSESTQSGIKWTTKYTIIGAGPFDYPHILDGLNSEGLSVGLFLFPNFAGYQKVTPENQGQSLAAWELGTYLLSQCANVDEVKQILPSLTVASVVMPKMGFAPPVHYAVNDTKGNSIVVEYVDGKLNVYDNPIGTITNSPTFDWHLTNLNNYINLKPADAPPAQFGDIKFSGFGQGTGLLGLRGDFTPPSRFIRAVFFSQSGEPMATGEETVFQMFHLLNQFDIPKGSVRGTYEGKQDLEFTNWTSVSDLNQKKFYYRTYFNPEVRMLDLNKVEFKDNQIMRIKMTWEGEKPNVTDLLNKPITQ